MAKDWLAPWHQRKTQGALRRPACAGRRRTGAVDQGQKQTASAWRGSLARREHRATGEKKNYLANLPTKTDLRTLAATIKARWVCEQAHQQLKEEIGLDHFEGRCWQGLHRHALMTMIAYAFLQHRRLAAAKRKKRTSGPPPQPTLPAVRQAILALFARPPPHRCPHCRKWICNGGGLSKKCQSSARPCTHKPSGVMSVSSEAWLSLFDDVVGAGEQCGRHLNANLLRCPEIDHQFEFYRLLDRQVTRLGPV